MQDRQVQLLAERQAQQASHGGQQEASARLTLRVTAVVHRVCPCPSSVCYF